MMGPMRSVRTRSETVPRRRFPLRIATAVPALLLCAALSTASSQPAAPAGSRPSDLESMGQALDGLARRLDQLVTQASRDPRWDLVEAYRRYRTEDDFENRKRPVNAEKLLDIWSDSDAPTDLRQAAWDAMVIDSLPRNYDPDLVAGSKTSRKPRNDFARRKVVPLLSSDDPVNRQFSHDWLLKMIGKPPNESAIEAFDARKSTKNAIKEAQQAW